MKNLIAFAAGLVFAVGLGISGLTRPDVILGFLDFSGDWNPAMLFVMAAGSGVYGLAWRLKRKAPALGGTFPNPKPSPPDLRMITGAVVFGAGWGLAGLCPGPAVTSLGNPSVEGLAFFGAMLAGMFLFHVTEQSKPSAARTTVQCS
jgi:hypothetical protein